jgi:Cytosol aminopeptidase family, N-terminal domain
MVPQRLLKSASISTFALLSLIFATQLFADTAPAEKFVTAPHDQTVSVKMIGPVTQTTDLEILCVLEHDPAGDKYIEAMKDFNNKLGGLLLNLRTRGEFVGEMGETLLFTPPAGTIAAKQVLFIGVGPEADLTLEKLKLVGRIAAREAVRLKVSKVSFVPTLRDQGSFRIDVGDGDAAVAGEWVLAYDTEMRLQNQGLSDKTTISSLVIEAGPKYFDGAVEKVTQAVNQSGAAIDQRTNQPYVNTGK